MNRNPYISILWLCLIIITSCTNKSFKKAENNYPIIPIPFTDVKLHDNFWLPRILKNTEITIPIAFKQSEETGRIKNFEVAGGLTEGTFCTKYAFDDSDVYKIMEGAAYSLMIKNDPDLEAFLDSLIFKIAAAQEDDGYIYTNRTILGDSAHEMAGPKRWSQVREHSHELYNVGHMYEAAVAHYQATGKNTFLDIAIKNADLIDREFGWGKIEKYPGHQEIEIGLVKLYRATGDPRYLDLAKFFLDVRGPDGWEYNQAHQKVIDQKEPIGHAVRALYMYSGMADVAALTGDENYLNALDVLWENIVNKKIYITGGVGQTGGNEGFGSDYELPNLTAYCETCASIANVFWNHRMFLLSGESKYIDVLERTMYNALLSGVALSGDLFFYPNPLESDSSHQRQEWFGCACCPSNISRFLPSVPGYIYASKDDEIFINLFIESETSLETANGKMTIAQQSNYPWEGEVTINIYPEYPGHHKILIRIPGWARNKLIPGNLYHYKRPLDRQVVIRINEFEIDFKIVNGYAVLDREWDVRDKIKIYFPMPVNEVLAHKNVTDNSGRFALQRGPIVFCVEDKDQKEKDIRHIVSTRSTGFTTQLEPELLNGVQTIEFYAHTILKNPDGKVKMDRAKRTIKAIPYCVWANRGLGEMIVWIPYKKKTIDLKPDETTN
ncbi:MAG: glycoside hydrolase family 127 protein [Bacteroidales bacterium]|nr:glycoside hydrolase family 127 protein [Bacteroidales bacterium]